ncbi:PIN domain-containing protein [Nonomuraea sp. NPDC049480]|uniref:PIN domain-containing protein n=1 Tax=Nonomuraea sp. NPDC049480 TaxID=3364353 RepID=UPI0037A7D25F
MTVYLVDKSAWEWGRRDPAANADFAQIVADRDTILAACHLTTLELAYSARNAAQHATVIAQQRKNLLWLPVTEVVMDRTLDIVALLAKRGQHRTPVPDVIIAATAEAYGATMLHVDSDYELIAAVTGQPVRRLATNT